MTDRIAITIPRSFAALAKAASTDPEVEAWKRTVLVEQLPGGRVRGCAADGHAMLRMEASAPEVNLDLFGTSIGAADEGASANPTADDLATVVKAVKVPKDCPPPPIEVVLGAEPMLRCGSEARRIQVEGGVAAAGWPNASAIVASNQALPVVCSQFVSVDKLRTLLAALTAAGAGGVKLAMRGALTALELEAVGEDGEAILGLLMPIKFGGETTDEREEILRRMPEAVAEAARAIGCDAEVVKR